MTISRRELLDALWEVESGCRLNPPDGDGGMSIGPYQIQRAYWQDALQHRPSLGGVYQDVRKKAYAEQVMDAYWDRYATAKRLGHPPTNEDLARIHNGGPNGYKIKSTIPYWRKVCRVLQSTSR